MYHLFDDDWRRRWRLHRCGCRRNLRRRRSGMEGGCHRLAGEGQDRGTREDPGEADRAAYAANGGAANETHGAITRRRVKAPTHHLPGTPFGGSLG
jgi:hypothetical protein